MKKNLLFTLFLTVSVLTFGQKLPFQGKLIDSGSGTPVEGNHSFVFEITSVGWSETHSSVSVTDGLYFVVLGTTNPLPDSLFYGVTEQSMAISVDGTALSPVTLFKPLSTPFEGGELVVHNEEGTVVGKMYAITDSVNKNGELNLYGTNGIRNVRLSGSGSGGNNGSLIIYDSSGNPKANMFIIENANTPEGAGFFTAIGNNNIGGIQGGFKFWEGPEGSSRPYFTMEGADIKNKELVWMEVVKTDTIESGKMRVNSNDGSETSVAPGEIAVKNTDGTVVGSVQALSQGDNKNGEVNVYGTNGNKNITLGAISHWQTPGNDFGWLTISDDEGMGRVSLMVTPYRGEHGSGEFTLRGETNSSIYQGFNSFDNLWEYPTIGMSSTTGNRVNIDVTKSDTVESGQMSLTSSTNEELYACPTGVFAKNSGTQLAEFTTQDWGGQGQAGLMRLNSPSGNSRFELTAQSWINPEFPWFKMSSENNFDAINMFVANDSTEAANVNLNSLSQRTANLTPTSLIFHQRDNFWNRSVYIEAIDHDETGWAGYFALRGPNSDNLNFGARYFDGNADLPFIHFIGENDFLGMDMGISKNNQGEQYGFINLVSETGKNLYLSPDGLGINKINLNTVTENGGSSGEIYLWGENGSPNIQMGGQHWGNHDLGNLTVFTDKSNGNGWYYGAASIYANTNGTDSWGRLSLFNNGIERILLNGENGKIDLSSDNAITFLEPYNISIIDKSDPNNWRGLASMGINNDNGSWVGTIDVSGPTTGNVHIGSQQNADLPWITLQGTEGFEAMQIGAVDDATQRGFIKMVNKQSGEEMFYSSHGVGGNTPFQISGGSIVYGTLEVSGSLTLNGDTIYPGVSDRRYKTNIQSLGNNILGKVELVRGVSYDWRKDEFPEKHFTNAKQIGVIAQELEAQFPELVKTNAEGYKSVNYDGLSAVLIEAVKELNAEVKKLQAENLQLKAELSASASNKVEIEQLKAEMQSLVKMVQGQEPESAMEASTSNPGLK